MKLESPAFDRRQLDDFRLELMAQDREVLAARLEAASGRVRELAARVAETPPSDSAEWNAREVLAHIAVLSKFYGVAAKRIAEGTWQDFDLLEHVAQRDVAGRQVAELPIAEVVALIGDAHARTLAFLHAADPASLYRRAGIGGGVTMSAEEILRLALCAHLELHAEQLERALMTRA